MSVAPVLASLLLLSCACAGPSAAPETPASIAASPPGDPSPKAPPSTKAADAETPTEAKHETASSAESPAAARDPISAVPCNIDNDCGWDDPCKPTRCVEAGVKATCKDSAPAPGECMCVAKACTLKPKTRPKAEGPCDVRACVVDRAAGKCIDDDGGVPENLRTTPAVEVGPSCDCTRLADGCAWSWFEPVACKSDRDCWIDPSPRKHPVARPKKLRGRDFKPCSDGEVAPRCGPAGTCVIGPAYSC
jgi:hypothetical protein